MGGGDVGGEAKSEPLLTSCDSAVFEPLDEPGSRSPALQLKPPPKPLRQTPSHGRSTVAGPPLLRRALA